MGIEPTSEAWEALNKTLKAIDLAAFSFSKDDLSWKLDGNCGRTARCDVLDCADVYRTVELFKLAIE